MSTHEEIAAQFQVYLEENAKFEAGVKAAAARTRKALGELNKLAKTRRAEIQEKKHSVESPSSSDGHVEFPF